MNFFNDLGFDLGTGCNNKGVFKISKNNLWGLAKWSGLTKDHKQLICPCIYSEIGDFYNGFAKVQKDGKRGFINELGKEVCPCIYDNIKSPEEELHEELYMVEKKGKRGSINKTWKEICPCIYDDIKVSDTGIFGIKKDGKWGFINEKGDEICNYIYEDVGIFKEFDYCNYLIERVEGSYSFKLIDSGMFAKVKKDGKWGFINEKGDEICKFLYDDAGDFCDTRGYGIYAKVQKDGKRGFINASGKEICPCYYDDASDFGDATADIENNGKRGTLYWDGEIAGFKIIAVENNGKYGFVREDGLEICPCIYDKVEDFKYDDLIPRKNVGCGKVQKHGKRGLIDEKGKEVCSCIYDKIGDIKFGCNSKYYAYVYKNGGRAWRNDRGIVGKELLRHHPHRSEPHVCGIK